MKSIASSTFARRIERVIFTRSFRATIARRPRSRRRRSRVKVSTERARSTLVSRASAFSVARTSTFTSAVTSSTYMADDLVFGASPRPSRARRLVSRRARGVARRSRDNRDRSLSAWFRIGTSRRETRLRTTRVDARRTRERSVVRRARGVRTRAGRGWRREGWIVRAEPRARRATPLTRRRTRAPIDDD